MGRASGPIWLELLVFRPILVGWREGYRGHTFRVLGRSGPSLVDLATSPVHVSQAGATVAVQPHDVIGWAVFGDIGGLHARDRLESRDAPAVPERALNDAAIEYLRARDVSEGAACLGSAGCDEAGLCVFDAPLPPSDAITLVSQVEPTLGERLAVLRQPADAPFSVRPALNISEFVEAETSYEELMTVRQRLEHPDLQLFEDKIRLRRELLPEVGVASTPSIHISYEDAHVVPHLVDRRGFVVKPSHMSESQFVFVVQDGIHLLQQAWGHPGPWVSPEEIQAAVDSFMNLTAKDWECRALLSARPGVIVEELVLAQDSQGKLSVDEYKFYTVWGEVVFGENVPFSFGTAMEIARNGQVYSAKVACPPMCPAPCYAEMVRLAEKVAKGARADFLRVDLLVRGRCEALFVSEVELFPASDFSPELKAEVAKRWRKGYGV